MPLDERSSSDRCSLHPSQSAVAACAGCGRSLCLACAVPVRGEIYGHECLESVLGPGAITDPGPPPRYRPPRPLVGIGSALAVLAILLPWKRFGLGSGPFGAFGVVPRWSWLVIVGAVFCLATWLILVLRRATPGRRWDRCFDVAGAAVVVGAVMSVIAPRGFGPIAYGPLVATIGGILVIVGARDRGSPAQRLDGAEAGVSLVRADEGP